MSSLTLPLTLGGAAVLTLAGVLGWLLYRRKKQREEAEAYDLLCKWNWAHQRGDNLATTCDIKTPRFNYIKVLR